MRSRRREEWGMTCLFCHKGPMHGVTVYRVNAKGQPGVWACAKHIKQTDAIIPEDVKTIASIIDRREAQ